VIRAEKTNFSISLMCRVLEVSRSGYYAWESREEHRKQKISDERRLADKIKKSHQNKGWTYLATVIDLCGRRVVGIG
jgi:hypothetical protein